MLCSFCCEEIADGAIKCKNCGEILDKEQHDALKDQVWKQYCTIVTNLGFVEHLRPFS